MFSLMKRYQMRIETGEVPEDSEDDKVRDFSQNPNFSFAQRSQGSVKHSQLPMETQPDDADNNAETDRAFAK